MSIHNIVLLFIILTVADLLSHSSWGRVVEKLLMPQPKSSWRGFAAARSTAGRKMRQEPSYFFVLPHGLLSMQYLGQATRTLTRTLYKKSSDSSNGSSLCNLDRNPVPRSGAVAIRSGHGYLPACTFLGCRLLHTWHLEVPPRLPENGPRAPKKGP